MFVRISTFKFPNQTKADAFSELYKNTLMEKYIKNTKIIKLFSFRPGEGKVTGIAFYKSLKDYKLTESKIKKEVSYLIKSLDGYVEWQSGEVFSKWEKD